MGAVRRRLGDLARLADSELARIFADGTLPDAEALAGCELRGRDPSFHARLLGTSACRRGFFWKTVEGRRELWTYHVPERPDAPSAASTGRGEAPPKGATLARVIEATPGSREHDPANALVLDARGTGGSLRDASFALRQHLVRVDEDNDDLYLSRTCVALGPLRVAIGYVILERLVPDDHQG